MIKSTLIKYKYLHTSHALLPVLLEELYMHFTKQEIIEENSASFTCKGQDFKFENNIQDIKTIDYYESTMPQKNDCIIEIKEETFFETVPPSSLRSGRSALPNGSEIKYFEHEGKELIAKKWSQKVMIVT